jgi:hypothetical protein
MEKIKSKNGQYISSEKEIFERHVQPSNIENCWDWLSYKNPSGYGQTKIGGRNGKHILAHRLSWIVYFGEIPEGMHVCHKCDNPSCVNPNHLFLGTNLDNIKDRMKKGRSVATWKGVPREKHPSCKVTDIQIAEMVNLRKLGKSIPTIAPMFGITPRHISKLTSKFIQEK